MRVLQIGRGHPLVKFVDLGLEVMMGSARAERRLVRSPQIQLLEDYASAPNAPGAVFRPASQHSAAADPSVSRSDRDIDRQVQLDDTRLLQRHGQVIVQFNPGVGVAWRPPELLEDDLAGLPKR